MGFDELIAPVNEKKFFEHYYEKQWLHIEGLNLFKDVFTLGDFETYLFSSRPWEMRDAWTQSGMLAAKHPNGAHYANISSVEEALELYALGYTIVLPLANYRWPKLSEICGLISEQLNVRANANIYLTPPNSKGFTAHYDMHDVLLLQTEGVKKWVVSKCDKVPLTLTEDMTRPEFYTIDPEKDLVGARTLELKRGQVLYMPRGTIHKGEAVGDKPSMHITFNILPTTWYNLIEAANQCCIQKNRGEPNHVTFEDLCDLSAPPVRKKASSFLNKSVLKEECIKDRTFKRKNEIAPGKSFQSVNQIQDISSETTLVRKPNAKFFIFDYKSDPWVSYGGRKIKIPPYFLEATKKTINRKEFTIQNIDGLKSREEKLSFAQWLIKKGFATISEL